MTLNCGPVYAVAFGLSTAAKNRERIEPRINSKYLLPVLAGPNVVNALEWLALLVQVLDGRLVLARQFLVESQESRHQNANDAVHNEGHHY